MRIILLANNLNIVKEIKNLLKDYEIVLPEEIGLNIEIEDIVDTVENNSIIKARMAMEKINENILSVESGLFVKSLNNLPGTNTYNFLGENATDEERCNYIIENVTDKDRKAEILTCATLILNGKEYIVTGVTEGIIAKEPRGVKGEWYDKILEVEDGKTVSELPKRERDRANSIRRAIKKLYTANVLTTKYKLR